MKELFEILFEIMDTAADAEFEKWRKEKNGSAQNLDGARNSDKDE